VNSKNSLIVTVFTAAGTKIWRSRSFKPMVFSYRTNIPPRFPIEKVKKANVPLPRPSGATRPRRTPEATLGSGPRPKRLTPISRTAIFTVKTRRVHPEPKIFTILIFLAAYALVILFFHHKTIVVWGPRPSFSPSGSSAPSKP